RYSLTIKRQEDGFASNYIFDNWRKGTVIEASAPMGEFVFEPLRDARNIVGLAGGCGITPFYSLAQAIAEGTEDVALTLLYGSRRHDEIVLKKELEALSASCDKIKIVHVLSDDPQAEGYEHGFLTAELIKKYAPAGEFSVFVCGPNEMYRFIEKELVKLQLPKRRIRFETAGDYKDLERDKAFPDSAIGKTYRIKVDMWGKKKTVQARSGESILVALERAGIAVPSICRSGECGYCRSRLVSGSYYIPDGFDHRRMADLKFGYIHPCCTFPTGDLSIRIASDEGEIKRGTMQQRRRLVGLLMTLIMSTFMGIVATLIARSGMPPQALASAPPAAVMVISSVLMSLTVGIIIWLVIPSSKWGSMLAAKAKASPGSFKFTALNCLPISFINSFIIGIVVSFVNVSRSHAQIPAAAAPPLFVMWFGSWIKMFPILLAVAFVIALLISPLIVRWVKMPQGMPKK
ncbi:MAG TPA: 2Fe-2S iron-sulfur cluster-binding protein, partial [Clostridia bacterium]|nr:2Fe-2S iron-sulfur cluster-binding protein [Clostridia bacterium]